MHLIHLVKRIYYFGRGIFLHIARKGFGLDGVVRFHCILTTLEIAEKESLTKMKIFLNTVFNECIYLENILLNSQCVLLLIIQNILVLS